MKNLHKILIAVIAVVGVGVSIFLYAQFTSPGLLVFDDMQLGEGDVGVLFLGDSAFILKTSNCIVIIDPATKISPDLVSALGEIDAILITHEHSDHFDATTTFELHRANEAVVIANEGAYQSLQGLIHRPEKLIQLGPGEGITLDGIDINAVASNHSGLSPLMYVLSMDGITILHASDSGYSQSLDQYAGKIDIALLPTGGASPTASPSQAFGMARILLPKIVIPMHGTSAQYSELQTLSEGLTGVSFTEVQTLTPQKISLP